MEIELQRESFIRTLNRIQGVVERRNTMPILACALMDASNGELTVSATDLEVSVRTLCPAEIIRPGRIAVGAKKLFDVVRELPDQPIRLRLEDDAARLRLTCGRSRFTLSFYNAEQFPEIPKAAGELSLTLDSVELSSMIAKTQFAMSMDETRYTLNGLFLQLNPEEASDSGGEPTPAMARLVATDTHRLALVERPLPEETAKKLTEKRECIVPKKAVAEIRKVLDEEQHDVELSLGPGYLQLSKPGLDMVSKLVEGRFPDYRRVIPDQDGTSKLDLDKKSFQSAIKRVSVLSNEKSRGLRVGVKKDLVRIASDNPEQDEAVDELQALYDGPEQTIGFNARYLQEIVNAMDGDVARFSIRDEDTPVMALDPESDDYFYILMPMRV